MSITEAEASTGHFLREDIRITNRDTSERFYPYPPTGEQLDSVTTCISATNSKPWIAKWHGSSSAAWCVDNMELLAATLRDKGREAAIDLGKDAAELLRGVKRDAGSYVHDVQEALILWAASPAGAGADISIPLLPAHLEEAWYDDDEPLVDVVDCMITGFMQFVSDFSPRFLATEMAVYSQPLGIAGTLDMIVALEGYAVCPDRSCGDFGGHAVASPGSTLVTCVDTKTGKNPEGTWKEQLAGYRRMTECLLPMREMAPMPATNAGAVLHLRPDYPGGYLLMLVAGDEDEAAWLRFQKAVSVYRERQKVKDKPGKAIRALREDGSMPGPRLCDLAAEGYGRALAPLRKALGAETELADLARFTLADVLAIKGVGPKLIDVIRQMLAGNGLCLSGEELLFVVTAVRDTAGQDAA
ncbi:MAG: hypothetical protein M3Y33_22255 [Actinomycetota bacterium]|nr:hypothetical protein [Actinomycetota bacterium]